MLRITKKFVAAKHPLILIRGRHTSNRNFNYRTRVDIYLNRGTILVSIRLKKDDKIRCYLILDSKAIGSIFWLGGDIYETVPFTCTKY